MGTLSAAASGPLSPARRGGSWSGGASWRGGGRSCSGVFRDTGFQPVRDAPGVGDRGSPTPSPLARAGSPCHKASVISGELEFAFEGRVARGHGTSSQAQPVCRSDASRARQTDARARADGFPGRTSPWAISAVGWSLRCGKGRRVLDQVVRGPLLVPRPGGSVAFYADGALAAGAGGVLQFAGDWKNVVGAASRGRPCPRRAPASCSRR